jgi:glycine/D-amino acid oxidase-like deaminating enzyme
MTQQKFLIVGAGVAGITLAKHLIDAGHHITLVDSGNNRSSAVAAGLINPMVFRRMTKSWRLDEFSPFAIDFYTNWEQACNTQFYHPITIRRMFSSEQERGYWLKKQSNPDYQDYLTEVNEEDETYSLAKNDFGTGRVKRSSFISPKEFLAKGKEWIEQNNTVRQEQVDYSVIDPESGTYKGVNYDGIVFCEGVEIRHNPWFNHVPINPTKGETLTIESSSITETESLNRKCFILPIGDGKFRVGATYVWETYEDELTEEGKNDLIEKIQVLTDEPFEVIGHHAGIRPTMLDRRPILGRHPDYPSLYVYNGLGTKGYMLAPLLSKEMADFILHETEVDKEVSLGRFSK